MTTGTALADPRPRPSATGDAAATLRRELGDFLRSRRERITPEEAGLPGGGRRRTPGLRREEVALLAGVSTTWYTWLEQGRDITASAQVLRALGRVLRLSATENQYVATLMRPGSEPDVDPGTAVPEHVHRLLTHLEPWPAFVQDLRGDVLAYNRTYGNLLCRLDDIDPRDRNCLWLSFTDPEWIAAVGDELDEFRAHLVGLHRARLAHRGADPTCRDLVERLSACSEEFAELWARHDVADRRDRTHKTFHNRHVGTVVFDVTTLWTGPSEGARLLVYEPSDPVTAERVARIPA